MRLRGRSWFLEGAGNFEMKGGRSGGANDLATRSARPIHHPTRKRLSADVAGCPDQRTPRYRRWPSLLPAHDPGLPGFVDQLPRAGPAWHRAQRGQPRSQRHRRSRSPWRSGLTGWARLWQQARGAVPQADGNEVDSPGKRGRLADGLSTARRARTAIDRQTRGYSDRRARPVHVQSAHARHFLRGRR